MSKDEKDSGARVAAYAEAIAPHQFDLSAARRGDAFCLCGEALNRPGGVDMALAVHQAEVAVGPVADAELAGLRQDRDEWKQATIAANRRLEAAEARESALRELLRAVLASERGEG